MFDVTLAFVNGVLSVECGAAHIGNPEDYPKPAQKFETGGIEQNASPYFGVQYETSAVNPDNLQPIPTK